jgi:hypothetical protein
MTEHLLKIWLPNLKSKQGHRLFWPEDSRAHVARRVPFFFFPTGPVYFPLKNFLSRSIKRLTHVWGIKYR